MRLHHLSLLFLGLVGGFAAQAARAPDPRPWVDGWKVEGPEKRATFERKEDVLTIVLPENEFLWKGSGLFREISGDFVVEIRLAGSFTPSEEPSENRIGTYYSTLKAGLGLWVQKEEIANVYRVTYRRRDLVLTRFFVWLPSETNEERSSLQEIHIKEWSPDREVYLRLRRKGNDLSAAFSADGKKWYEAKHEIFSLPTKLRLSVFAESKSMEPFKPRFDRFRLTHPGK